MQNTRYAIRNTQYEKGMTLIELMVALMVASIVLAAIASLAFAMGTANDSSNLLSKTQAQIRFTTVRLSDLIRHSRLVCVPNNSDDLAIWQGDFDGDNQMDPNELVYIEAGAGRNYIKLLEFPNASGSSVSLSDIQSGSAKQALINSYSERQVALIPLCSNVQFYPAAITAESDLVSILFEVADDEGSHQYQITATLASQAANLIDDAATSIISDDD